MYRVVDLFAGAGGLSLGFLQAGKFRIVAASENNSNAKLTYKKNHPSVDLMDDIRSIDYSELKKRYGSIDVVIGGPPCQGFSNANRQKAQAICINNGLVKEYVRAICELRPRVFVLENVSMLRSEVHRFYYSQNDALIIDPLYIELRNDELELLPERFCPEKRDHLVETLNRYSEYLWSNSEYIMANVLYRQRRNHEKLKKAVNKYSRKIKVFAERLIERGKDGFIVRHADFEMAMIFGEYLKGMASEDQLLSAIEIPVMFQRMYQHYEELIENKIQINGFSTLRGICAKVSSFSVFEYIEKTLSAKPYCYEIKTGVLNAADFGAPQKRERFIMIGAKNRKKPTLPKGKLKKSEYCNVKDVLYDLESVLPSCSVNAAPKKLEPMNLRQGTLLAYLRDSEKLYNHVITETRQAAMERFKALKPGQNFHSLGDALKSTYTDAKRTQNTIYLRLNYDEPSGTVVNVRKSMWVHPVLDRALSIREAARLQTFPDSFIFEGTKDAQYQQVGNAVPPVFAKAIAEKVIELLEEKEHDD